jgi:hypothetical protein
MFPLAESKSLGTAEAFTGLEPAHFAFTCALMLLVGHLNVFRRVAATPKPFEEGAVTPIKDIYFGVRELGVKLSIRCSVLSPDMAGHQRSTVSRVLAMKDKKRSTVHGSFEELGSQKILVIMVNSTINVATLILVFETAIDDHLLVKVFCVLAIQNLQQSLLGDSRNGICRVVRQKVGKDRLMCFLDIHNGLQCGWGSLLVIRL